MSATPKVTKVILRRCDKHPATIADNNVAALNAYRVGVTGLCEICGVHATVLYHLVPKDKEVQG